jgi:hypothetical protein
MRLARAAGGGVAVWMELPIDEVLRYVFELTDQLKEERDAEERALKRK